MVNLSKCLNPTYVVTVRYGKEELAEKELGDALFYKDPNVVICRTSFKGVLLLKTSLSDEQVMELILAYPPSTIERMVRVITCCDLSSDLIKCLSEVLRNFNIVGYRVIRFGRKGWLSNQQVSEVLKFLKERINPSLKEELVLEPVDNYLCIGLVPDKQDRISRIRWKPYKDRIS